MRFDVAHTITGIHAADYERLYFDEAFNEALCAHLKLTRRLIRREEQPGHIFREVAIVPAREVPAPVAKIVGADALHYTETLDYRLGTGAGTWSTTPGALPGKITSDGRLMIEEAEGGVVRRVEGHVTVRLFGVGKMIERFIVADVERGYAEAAAFTQAWLAR